MTDAKQALEFKFGDLVENEWAATDNPRRLGFFVRRLTRTGRLNPGPRIELTDGKGSFWTVGLHAESRLRLLTTHPTQPEGEGHE